MNSLKKIFIGLATIFSAVGSVVLGINLVSMVLLFGAQINSLGMDYWFMFIAYFLVVSIPWVFFVLCKKFNDYKWLFLIDLLWLFPLFLLLNKITALY